MNRTHTITLVVPRDEANSRLPGDAPRHETDLRARIVLHPGGAGIAADAPPHVAAALAEAEAIGAAYDDRLHAWLSEDEENVHAYVRDPLGTLRTAPLGIETGALDRLAALAASITADARSN